jgi:hypothetical protein
VSEGSAGGWTKRVLNAAFVLLVVAVAARVTYELLAPLLPVLGVLVFFIVIYAVALGRLRK